MRLNQFLILIGAILIIVSCAKEKKNQDKEPLMMRETSELAIMMEQMYVFNDSVKGQILGGEEISKLPFELQELHTLEMTDRFERDDNFNKFSVVFEKYQKQLYTTTSDSLRTVYNNVIQTCIACHQTSCTGPIPRIKKLLID